MAINKVAFYGNTLIDLTSDTITPDKLFSGYTAHDQTGEKIVGTYVEPTPPSGSFEITENGTYDISNYESVVVNVAGNQPVEIAVVNKEVTLTEGGLYVLYGQAYTSSAYSVSRYVTATMYIPPFDDCPTNIYFYQATGSSGHAISFTFTKSTKKIKMATIDSSGNMAGIIKCYKIMDL